MKSIYSRFKKTQASNYDQDELVDYEEEYVLSYTEKGKIVCPSSPVTMDMIRSVILKQHCQITETDEKWFEDGLKWLAQQQYQNTNEYKYFIEEEQDYTQWSEKRRMLQFDIEDLERACEAYFGVPLCLCENHWAAEYLMQQAMKGNVLRRMKVKSDSSFSKVKVTLKKLLFGCFH
jgi:hypothetical protein